MEAFGKFITLLVLFVVNAITRGVVLSALWGWYFVRVGMRPIDTATAIGVAMTVGYLAHRINWVEERAKPRMTFKDHIYSSSMGIVYALTGLIIGWIISLFLPAM